MKGFRRTAGRRSGFTLIEIMVATAIMIVLVGLVIKVTSDILIVWNRSSGKLSAAAEARLALELITRDLENAVLDNNGKEWLRIESEGPGVGGPYAGQTVGMNLFAPALDFTPDPVAPEPGSLCAISYRLRFEQPFAGSEFNSYILYRQLVDPRTTFEDLLGSPDDGKQDTLTGGIWNESDVIDEENYLVGNVVEFKVVVYNVNPGTGLVEPLNAVPGTLDLLGDALYDSDNTTSDAVDPDFPLLYADITLKVISDEGMRLLQIFEERGPFDEFGEPEDIVQQHANSFTRRVNFFATAL